MRKNPYPPGISAGLDRILASRERMHTLVNDPDPVLAGKLIALVQNHLPTFSESWDLVDEAIHRLKRGVRIRASSEEVDIEPIRR